MIEQITSTIRSVRVLLPSGAYLEYHESGANTKEDGDYIIELLTAGGRSAYRRVMPGA